MNYYERARQIQPDLVTYRRYFHKNAEVGYDLPKATEYVVQKLKEFGYSPEVICQSGVVAQIGKPGKTVLLRADMDAMPMVEESGLPFACTDALAAHTCGHDLHTAALLGTARMLRENEEALRGTVKLMFQPAEEIFWGAKEMIKNGVLKNPTVDIAFAGHVTPRYPTGMIALRAGAAMASCYGFRIKIRGKAAHGANPYDGISPINIGVHIYLALQELIAREINFQDGATLTIGSFQSGNVQNTIPEEAELMGTLRTFNQEVRAYLIQRITCVVEKTAELFRGSAEVEVLSDVPVEYNNPKLTADVSRYFKDLFGREAVEDVLITGSEDFAFVSELVPTVDLYVGAVSPDYDGPFYSSHHAKIVFDEDAIGVSAALNAEVATRWLEENA